MSQIKRLRVPALCLVMLFLLCFASALRPGKAQVALYTVTDLGTLGGDTSVAYDINNSGLIVGKANTTPGYSNSRPFSWSGGVLTDLGSLGGYDGGAYSVNASGAVAGWSINSSGLTRPFLWTSANGMQDLGPISSGSQTTQAFGINNASPVQVVGTGETNVNTLGSRGFVWSSSTGMQMLGTLGGASSYALGINDSGNIVGMAQLSTYYWHAYIKTGASLTDLGTLGGTMSFAYDINNSGVVVGYSYLTSNSAAVPYRAFMWTSATGMTNLGTLGGTGSVAYGINGLNTVVGTSTNASGNSRAFIYDVVNGMRDLNNLTTGSGWTLVEARAINDGGKIVGYGTNSSGQSHAFLLTPVP